MKTIDKIKKELGALASKVSVDDKLQAAMQLKAHPETIARYLRGEVSKESFGLNLLSFLKNRIEEREKILA